MTQRVRLAPEKRRKIIVTAALKLSKSKGLFGWTFRDVAAACQTSTGECTVRHYFAIDELRRAVLADKRCTDDLTQQGKALHLI